MLSPAPTNADTDAVDGRFTVFVPGWHNPTRPLDVNGDGVVTPLDVLALVNYLNAQPGRALPRRAAPPPAYYDVNQDGRCTPLDVLLVINQLNGQSAGRGEGEAAPAR